MAWATKLVGRGAGLAELRRELQRAGAAEFRVVLLLSDAGIGRTRPHCALGLSRRWILVYASSTFRELVPRLRRVAPDVKRRSNPGRVIEGTTLDERYVRESGRLGEQR